MKCGRSLVAAAASLLVSVSAGCQQPKTDMSEMMKPPARPAELERLDMFVGVWDGKAETRIPGVEGVQVSTAVNTVSWEAAGWLLVERFEAESGDGEKLAGLGAWDWDARAGKYRYWWADNFGVTTRGTATYDDDARTWFTEGKSYNSRTGEKSVDEGVARMIGDDTIEWEHESWDAWRLRKRMEMEGVNRRR